MMTSRNRPLYVFMGGLILLLAACVRPINPAPATSVGGIQNTRVPTTQAPQPTEVSQTTEVPQITEAPTATPGSSDGSAELVNTQWKLVSFVQTDSETQVITSTEVTLEFGENGEATGSGGCNVYGAQYEVQGSAITFSQTINTKMACTEAGVMDQEGRYFQALQSASEFSLSDEHLTIRYDNGSGSLNFTRTEGAPTPTPAPGVLCITVRDAAQAGWKECRSQQYGFEVQFPSEGKLGDQTETTARIDLTFTTGTNLTEKYLDITVQENANSCSSPQAAGYAPGTIPREAVQFNGLDFIKESGQGAATGNLYDWEAYSITRDNLCISLSFVLHSFTPELVPTPPPVYDKAAESRVFPEIASTFAWLEPAGTPTPGAAQATPVPKLIVFETGKTSAAYNGHLDASGSDLYVLRALQGQTLTADLSFSEGQGILAVWGADGTVLMSDHSESTHFEGVLPSTQDYYIQVEGRPDGMTDYSLKVNITPLEAGELTQTPQRIRFETGKTSATVTGHMAASDSDLYVLRALKGQTMTAELSFTRGHAILVVWGADGSVLMSDHAGESSFQGVLPSTQDYYIQVEGLPDEGTDYSLKVTIPPLVSTPPMVTYQTIHFAPGAKSATLTGQLAASRSVIYRLYALSGQTMKAKLSFTQGKAILAAWGQDGTVLLSDHAGASSFERKLPSSQYYYIQVRGRPDGPTDYSLKITIPPK
jgi:heat shock protein HslJ